MLPSPPPLSRGHVLFRDWLIRTYGASERRDAPLHDGLRRFLREMNALLAGGAAQIGHTFSVYPWLLGYSRQHRPGDPYRVAIARLSGDAVPVCAWSEPAEQSPGDLPESPEPADRPATSAA